MNGDVQPSYASDSVATNPRSCDVPWHERAVVTFPHRAAVGPKDFPLGTCPTGA
jgi:hypothetical protein